jgi:hypothetical protein
MNIILRPYFFNSIVLNFVKNHLRLRTAVSQKSLASVQQLSHSPAVRDDFNPALLRAVALIFGWRVVSYINAIKLFYIQENEYYVEMPRQ